MQWHLEEAVEFYRKQGAPRDQNALTALLKEIQRENGGIPRYAVEAVADAYGIKASLLLALIRRLPSLRLADTHLLEICCGPNCPRKRNLVEYVEKTWGEKPEKFTVKQVPCMRMCGKGPNVRWDGVVYHGADEKLLRKLIDEE